MKRLLYLDTNVILARYAPEEPHHDDATSLLNKIEVGEFTAVTSILTLLEVASATSRAYDRFVPGSESMKREDIVGAFLRRVMALRNLEFIPLGGEITFNADERNIRLPAVFWLALEICVKTGVKTLDNIHLATASIASRIYGHEIERFVT
jgi:predicted nucleic acid-binding protein